MTDYPIKIIQHQDKPQVKPFILVVTPYSELGVIICESLKESAEIQYVTTISKVISILKENDRFTQVLLDLELGELNVLNLGRELRQINPSIGLLLISKQDPPTNLDEIQPWEFLRKPLLLRDIQAALGFEAKKDKSPIEIESFAYENRARVDWLNNSASATRLLISLIEKSNSRAALLFKDQTLWSHAGQLGQESMDELSGKIGGFYKGGENNEFLRYIKLETSRSEFIIYSTIVAIGLVLTLVFNPDVPLKIVRKNTRESADTLLPSRADNLFKAMTLHDQMKNLNRGEIQEEISSRLPSTKVMEEKDTADYSWSRGYRPPYADEIIMENQNGLSYSCLLIPRFPSQILSREKVDLVSEWIKKINISFGWRLEDVTVQPEYTRWTTSIPPSIAPTTYLETIRKETSKRIFNYYPPFKEENPSGDYWAPGFLILEGKNSISDQLVSVFIKQNRQKQGLQVD